MTDLGASTFVSAIQQWQQGRRDEAVAMVRALADEGDPRAQILVAWFLHQNGEPGWREAVPYAKAAVAAGYPQAASYVVGNMMSDPSLIEEAGEIARMAAAQGIVTVDPINQAIAFAQQGNEAGVAQMLAVPWPFPGPGAPITPEYWTSLVDRAQTSVSTLAGFVDESAERRDQIATAATDMTASIAETRTRIEAQATNLLSFITQTTNAEASKFFEDEAQSSKHEADSMWKWGVRVVVAAAGVSVLPLVAHYFRVFLDIGPHFSSPQLISIHITGALALGTLAGVMLARARVRDRNRQRNTDLRVALQMMFAYAQQIENPVERQQFIQSNGRVVLEAFLRQDAAPVSEESRNLLAAINR